MVDTIGGHGASLSHRLGANLPDPIVSGRDRTDPEQQALVADGVGLALLVVLDTLTPAERLAFVLHDSFAMPYEEIAPILGRSPAAARQLASRARPVLVNGAAGVVAAPRGRPFSVLGFTVVRGTIVEIDILADPERLRGLDLAALDG